jgi:dethiobiotin synthetase
VPAERRGRPDRLVLVTGTGTEVGKTWVAARLLGELRRCGAAVAARKPAQSFAPGSDPARRDAAVLGAASGEPPETVCPRHRWYASAMAPPMAAAALAAPRFSIDDLLGELCWPDRPASAVGRGGLVGVVELAGGVRSPQAADGDGVDVARRLAPDLVVVVADAGLGTINSVRLTAGALAGVGGPAPRGAPSPRPPALAVVLNRFDPGSDLHRRNRAWLASEMTATVLVAPGEEAALADLALAPGGLRAPGGRSSPREPGTVPTSRSG